MFPIQKQHLVMLAILLGIVFFVMDEEVPPLAVAQTAAPAATQYEYFTPSGSQLSKGKYEYLEITEGCDPYYEGRCLHAHTGPGADYEKIYELRKGMILKIGNKVERNGQVWYRIHFDEWLRYPERLEGDWYIPAVAGSVVRADGVQTLESKVATNKKIIVDLSEHMLYAYDGNKEFMTTKVATGIEFTPTPTGTFTVFKKTPTRYMQGPLPGVNDNPFDLPGVPWNLYFTEGGAVIHGSYWHDRYGTEQSSGCINLPPELAKILYDWADLGTTVIIRN